MARSAEQWTHIPGYKGFYEVSSRGRVRSLDRTVKGPRGINRVVGGKLLRVFLISGKCPGVTLSKKGVTRVFTVNSLIQKAFKDAS